MRVCFSFIKENGIKYRCDNQGEERGYNQSAHSGNRQWSPNQFTDRQGIQSGDGGHRGQKDGVGPSLVP